MKKQNINKIELENKNKRYPQKVEIESGIMEWYTQISRRTERQSREMLLRKLVKRPGGGARVER